MADPREEVVIDYTNYRGKRAIRRIRPIRIAFENSEWHTDTQWIVHALDVDRGELREFAMQDIHTWQPAPRVV